MDHEEEYINMLDPTMEKDNMKRIRHIWSKYGGGMRKNFNVVMLYFSKERKEPKIAINEWESKCFSSDDVQCICCHVIWNTCFIINIHNGNILRTGNVCIEKLINPNSIFAKKIKDIKRQIEDKDLVHRRCSKCEHANIDRDEVNKVTCKGCLELTRRDCKIEEAIEQQNGRKCTTCEENTIHPEEDVDVTECSWCRRAEELLVDEREKEEKEIKVREQAVYNEKIKKERIKAKRTIKCEVYVDVEVKMEAKEQAGIEQGLKIIRELAHRKEILAKAIPKPKIEKRETTQEQIDEYYRILKLKNAEQQRINNLLREEAKEKLRLNPPKVVVLSEDEQKSIDTIKKKVKTLVVDKLVDRGIVKRESPAEKVARLEMEIRLLLGEK